MALTEYQKKRHFRRTPEPAGKVLRSGGASYVIQKHAASHLHYDFRLELDGVLKSWAVPKGPSLDPAVKRLAMQVEDHPVQYGSFEGIIPEGEYGGGTVMLWDQGSWEPIGDPHANYRQGKLKFILHGEKLQGGWTLVRTRRNDSGKPIPWLLIKERDEAAQLAEAGDILEESPLSVVSGRDLADIANAKDRVWTSNGESKQQARSVTASKNKVVSKSRRSSMPSSVTGAVKASLPAQIEVQLATLTKDAPTGDEWLHEIKFDGYRMVCRIDGEKVEFLSRNQQDWTKRLGPLADVARDLPVQQAILDGEVVVMQPDGTTDFQALQNAFREGRVADLQYYVFDLLYLNGQSLLPVPLEERKRILADLLKSGDSKSSSFRYSEHVAGVGAEFQQQACRLHLEGTISKRRDQPYRSGRGYDWLKVKCAHKDEFVIGGYTEPSGSRQGFGALLVGYYDAQQKLCYAGKVGTGFDNRDLQSLYHQLKAIEQPKSPFSDRTRKVGPTRTAHWVEPSLVAQITFGGRTRDGILRHSVFAGLREDKPAEDVTLDHAIPAEQAVKKAKTRKVSPASNAKGKEPKAKPLKSVPSKGSINDAAYDAANQTFAGVRLTNPDKALYPDEGITKLELAAYYRDVADWILPHITHRPLVLVRCPDGRTKACFYQKHPGVGTPDNLRQIPIRESRKTENYVVVDDVGGLISLSQIGALEIHAWGSREDQLERPDRLIFDIDPSPDVEWSRVVDSARQIRAFLQELKLESFVKTTGGKGLHLVVPIDRRHDWDEAKSFCKAVADMIVSVAPSQYTANMSKAARPHKIFLDYLRNGRGATAVVPYSTRSRPGAPVSVPLTWKELSSRIRSDHFTIRNLGKRLSKLKQDPWEGMESLRQSLTGPINAIQKLSRSL